MLQELETHAPENLVLIQISLAKLNTLNQTVPRTQTSGSKNKINRNNCFVLCGGRIDI